MCHCFVVESVSPGPEQSGSGALARTAVSAIANM
jgi:hypothetical protein